MNKPIVNAKVHYSNFKSTSNTNGNDRICNLPNQDCYSHQSLLLNEDENKNKSDNELLSNISIKLSNLNPNNILPLFIPRLTTTPKKTMYVQTLFDYDPTQDSGLPSRGLAFHHGDILHVVNASDREWWQARHLSPTTNTELTNPSNNDNNTTSTILTSNQSIVKSFGIIPSRQRIERRQRIRTKRVNFLTKVTMIGSNLVTPPSSTSSLCAWAEPIEPNRPIHLDLVESLKQLETKNSGTVNTISNMVTHGDGPNSFASHVTSTLNDMGTHVNNRGGNEAGMNKKKRSTSLTRNFLKCFSYRGAKQDPICPISVKHRTCSLDAIGDEHMPLNRSYDLVTPVQINMARPVIILGPMKDRVIDDLLQDLRYATCVPHTTRPPTTNEKDGIDYHFVESKASMEENIRNKRFIEVDKFQDHYYALSLDSVWNTLRLGKSCILELDLDAVKLLEEAGLFPLSILLKPRSINCLRLMQHWLTEDQTRRSYESTLHIEDENWQFLSAIIPFNDLDEAVKLVQNFIQLHSGPLIWVPCRSSILQSDKFLIRSPDSSFCQSQEQSQLKGVGGVNDPPHPQTPNYRLADVSI